MLIYGQIFCFDPFRLMVYYGERDLRSECLNQNIHFLFLIDLPQIKRVFCGTDVVSKYWLSMRALPLIARSNTGEVGDREQVTMFQKRKLRKALKIKLAAAFGIAEKQIEIGCVTLQEDGLVVHVQHLIFSNEIDQYKEMLNQYLVSSEDYMFYVFKKKIKRISKAMFSHFEISKSRQPQWTVAYHSEMTAISSILQTPLSDDPEAPSKFPNYPYSADEQETQDASGGNSTEIPIGLPVLRASVVSYSTTDGIKLTGSNPRSNQAAVTIPVPTIKEEAEDSEELFEAKSNMEMAAMGNCKSETPAGNLDVARVLTTMREEMKRVQESQQQQNERLAQQLDQLSSVLTQERAPIPFNTNFAGQEIEGHDMPDIILAGIIKDISTTL